MTLNDKQKCIRAKKFFFSDSRDASVLTELLPSLPLRLSQALSLLNAQDCVTRRPTGTFSVSGLIDGKVEG